MRKRVWDKCDKKFVIVLNGHEKTMAVKRLAVGADAKEGLERTGNVMDSSDKVFPHADYFESFRPYGERSIVRRVMSTY